MDWAVVLEPVSVFLEKNNYSLQNPLVIAGLIGLGIGILRGWNFSQLFWFFLSVFILIFLSARTDAFLVRTSLNAGEEGKYFLFLSKGIFVLAIGLVFLYFFMIRE